MIFISSFSEECPIMLAHWSIKNLFPVQGGRSLLSASSFFLFFEIWTFYDRLHFSSLMFLFDLQFARVAFNDVNCFSSSFNFLHSWHLVSYLAHSISSCFSITSSLFGTQQAVHRPSMTAMLLSTQTFGRFLVFCIIGLNDLNAWLQRSNAHLSIRWFL